jgi:hypothetical protein
MRRYGFEDLAKIADKWAKPADKHPPAGFFLN